MAAGPSERRLIDFLLNTMCRIGEALSLSWDDVDFSERVVTVRTRKRCGGYETTRKIPMNDELERVLLEQREERHPRLPQVFWNPKTGDRWQGRTKLMQSLCGRAGVKRFGFHALRHFGASTLARKGTPVPAISKLLGHTSTRVTDRYIQVLDESLREHMQALGDITGSIESDEEKSHQSPITNADLGGVEDSAKWRWGESTASLSLMPAAPIP